MGYKEKIKEVDSLQKKINAQGTLSTPLKKKIDYKFRLDWNYYSNRMEGGTLTQAETRSVMVGNIEIEGKPFKDVMEMNGHNKAVVEILKIGKGELRIAEKRIKDIHKLIMYEENAEKASEVGKWKTQANEIIGYKDEKISFTPPAEVADAIHALLNSTNTQLDAFFEKRDSQHPVEIAAKFHIDYVTIHPFYDGNGRTARILTNLLLISCGFPPIIIKDEHKNSYYQLLGDIQAYGGNPELFYSFIAERLIDSQQLVLNAIDGKEIDEPGDLDKRISLLEKELAAIDDNETIKANLGEEYFEGILGSWVTELLKKVIPEIQKFNKFFKESQHSIAFLNVGKAVNFVGDPSFEIIGHLYNEFENNKGNLSKYDAKIIFDCRYGTFIKGGLKTFGCNYGFDIRFDRIKYEVYVDEFSELEQRTMKRLNEKLLHQPLSSKEIDKIVSFLTNAIYEHIDFHSKKNGLR